MLDIRQGDCRELMAGMEPASVDAIVTDPPYGLEFMGKEWDHGIPGVHFWQEALRVTKPGAHLVAFGGTRTFHRLTCALEDAGWEIRDCLCWLYGSGFPKSLDVSKAIDKAAGEYVPGDVLPSSRTTGASATGIATTFRAKTAANPATDSARQWSGWGTALKPAWEPIILARKPLIGTVAANVQAHGTGALNVDGCRIETETPRPALENFGRSGNVYGAGLAGSRAAGTTTLGRWPANVVLDEEAAEMLDEQSGERPVPGLYCQTTEAKSAVGISVRVKGRVTPHYGDTGGASRFFYTAKAASSERHYAGKNTHPTVKPVDLMRWLCRLVTPPGGLILDPFAGSGSTGIAALGEGFRFVGCELNPEYVQMARRRIAGPLFAENP